MDLLVSFHSQCRGVKFYDLRSAEAEWGTKLKLVKEPTNLHDPLCVAAWVPGISGERGADGARPLGPEKERMVGSEKNRSNSKTRNTPGYLRATEQLIIILACILNICHEFH